ncbi:conserved hypothetical protein [Uncinocarpus reesii 1704]|uniref:Oxo-4-hydroxy-4-carboxy-5-ureidoimidazoline decarboxylase domain-containing protein n=1 Tax=Uncinocarpus reesii (strain UAMH 1704) TaxID=336963 RepID=C4JV10_UNCRE|nr:uncharacterized protein UREG_04963 [Uncinocarpus reesii 1704]EEP80121.1 conserved hypothetical protein [Uncinocarpus reesii 1704]
MGDARLPDIDTLPTLPPLHCNEILDTLFERSKPLHSLAESLFLQKECTSYQALIDFVRARLTALASSDNPDDRTILLDILGSHPRLGEKTSPPNSGESRALQESPAQHLSELSRAEQSNLNEKAQEGSAQQLVALNREYEQAFPGLRYVYGINCRIITFVNGRGRDAIMEEMRQRIDRHDIELEVLEIIQRKTLKEYEQPACVGHVRYRGRQSAQTPAENRE